GELFQPRPTSRAGLAPVPSVARPPCPGAPEKFSGLIDRVRAADTRAKLPRPRPSPLNSVILRIRLVGQRLGAVSSLRSTDFVPRQRRMRHHPLGDFFVPR